MDPNDSNPGMVEREMDETPMEGRSMEREGMGGTDRDHLQGGGSVEREGMQGGELERDGMGGMDREGLQGGMERDGMHGSSTRDGGGSMEGMSSSDREIMQGSTGQGDMGTPSDRLHEANSNANDAEMRTSGREGGYGFDRPADVEVSRDDMQGSSRDTDQGTDREQGVSGDQPSGTTTARDW
jgi:hypothetical protein